MHYKECWVAKFLIKKFMHQSSHMIMLVISQMDGGYMPPKDFELVTSHFDTILFYVMRDEMRYTVSNLRN